jgi:peptidyl-prolyl cis-trans isomerase SurA
MKFFLTIVILYLSLISAHSIETKIVHRIQNEIITNIDIKNQFKYLVALNNDLKNLNKERIFNISNESIIREKIKRIELSKNFKEIKINKDYLNGLLEDTYLRLGLKSINQFTLYLKDYDLTLNEVEKKLTIDALWNQLIYQKYSSQITIDEEKLKNEIVNNSKQKIKEYHLSEITFEIKNKDEIENKYQEVISSINQIGFKNSASIYSFSDTSKIGGDIGWIKENLLNQSIKKNIKDLNIGEITQPIILSNGIMILKVDNTRFSEIEIDYEMELQKIIIYEKNRQLSQYSKIYFNKIKKNLTFDE